MFNATLSEIFEAKIRNIVSDISPNTKFDVEVALEANIPTALPYFRQTPSENALMRIPRSELIKLTKSISVTIIADNTLPKAAQILISRLLVTKLKLRPSIDGVEFDSIDMSVLDPSPTNFSQVVIEELRGSRQDAANSLAIARNEIERLERRVSEQAVIIAGNEDSNQVSQSDLEAKKNIGSATDIVDQLRQYIPHFVITLMLGTLAIIFVLAFYIVSKRLTNAIQNIAKVFDGIVESLSVSPGKTGDRIKDRASSEQTGYKNSLPTSPSGTNHFTLESVQARIGDIRKEIAEQLNPPTESILLMQLKKWCASKQTVAKGVQLLELLDRQKANQLFEKLDSESQEAILYFLQHGSSKGTKGEQMVHAGEEILTKLMAKPFKDSKLQLNHNVVNAIVKFTYADLIQVFRTIPTDLVPRLLLYFESSSIGDVLGELHKVDRGRFEDIKAILGQIPFAEEDHESDSKLLDVFNRSEKSSLSDRHRPYLKFYQDIIEQAPEELTETLLAEITPNSSSLDKHLRRHIVSFQSFFRLPNGSQAELAAQLSNREIAFLIADLKPESQNVLSTCLSARRLPHVEEELTVLKQTSDIKALKVGTTKARAHVVELIQQYKSNEMWEEHAGDLDGALHLAEAVGEASNETEMDGAA